jgi:hypothetical protein
VPGRLRILHDWKPASLEAEIAALTETSCRNLTRHSDCFTVSSIRPIITFLFFPAYSMAQWLTAGVTVGVPISPQSQRSSPGYLLNGTLGPNDLIIKPYLVGGTAQFKLWWKLSIVGEFQYQRIHEDFSYSSVKVFTDFGTRGAASADIWLFPLLLRYDLDHRKISPFVDLGATLRRLGPFNGKGTQLDFYLQPQPMSFHIVPDGNPEIAITGGAGIRSRVSSFDLVSEVRFMHWTSIYFVPAQNQVILTVSATFPVRRR